MPVHYAVQGWITGCGIDLEHLGECDRVVEDLTLVDCEPCLEGTERTQARQAVDGETYYESDDEVEQHRLFFEATYWQQALPHLRPDGLSHIHPCVIPLGIRFYPPCRDLPLH